MNFDIEINPRDSVGEYLVSARSDYGEVPETAPQTLPDDYDFTDVLTYLQELAALPEDAKAFGQRLWDFLFPQQVRELFIAAKSGALAERKKGLRLRLRIRAGQSELNDIPWEFCHDEQGFLALDETNPLVRYIPTKQPPRTMAVPEKVRMLVAMASPEDFPQLNITAEEAHIRQALAGLIEQQRIELALLNPATREGLFQQVQEFEPHILHFVGHGIVKEDGEGALVLDDGTGQSHLADAQDMEVLLRNRSARLVVLSACNTASHGGDISSQPIRGVAPKLVKAGIPAVIGMQFAVPDETAVALMQTLYQRLAAGEPLDMALTQARIGSYFKQEDKQFWAIPVLYMRAPDGVLWRTEQRVEPLPEEWPDDLPPMEMVRVPAGEFDMGGPGTDVPDDTNPSYKRSLPEFLIGKYPVTNEQYEAFVKDSGHPPPHHNWIGESVENDKKGHPVAGVSWYDAHAYCEWLSRKTGRKFRLPSEAEWEKAARGAIDERRYPWGDEWEDKRCHWATKEECEFLDETMDYEENEERFIYSVYDLPDQSPTGCCDMVGNIREWTNTLWGMSSHKSDFSYQWEADTREEFKPEQLYCGYRIHRGGAVCDERWQFSCNARGRHSPDVRYNARIGMRVVQDVTKE